LVLDVYAPDMRPKLSVVTLGVRDLQRARRFYEALGWSCGDPEPDSDVCFFTLDGTVLALYGWDDLASDADLAPVTQGSGFRGIALAHNEPSPDDVDRAYGHFLAAGAAVVKRPAATTWGGYSGYVTDLDGHLWEIAYNPFEDWT
jgi:catechol 2,3-dioxygenase-like lactoylglutathione lyase family enzyme